MAPLGKTKCIARGPGTGRDLSTTFEDQAPIPVRPSTLRPRSSLARAGAIEIGLADTIGVGNPAHVASLVAKTKSVVGDLPIRVHFHNTRGTGLANVWAAIGAGARVVDASIGGLGGCPFAPGAAGNVATEDVVYMLERAGIETGLSLEELIETNRWLSGVMAKDLPAMVGKSGGFPKPRDPERNVA